AHARVATCSRGTEGRSAGPGQRERGRGDRRERRERPGGEGTPVRKAGRPVTARGPAGRSAAARPVASPAGSVWQVRSARGRRVPGEPGAWDRDGRVGMVR